MFAILQIITVNSWMFTVLILTRVIDLLVTVIEQRKSGKFEMGKLSHFLDRLVQRILIVILFLCLGAYMEVGILAASLVVAITVLEEAKSIAESANLTLLVGLIEKFEGKLQDTNPVVSTAVEEAVEENKNKFTKEDIV